MSRKYTKVEHLISIIEERTKAGETYREIGASLCLTPRNHACWSIHPPNAGHSAALLRISGEPKWKMGEEFP